MIIIGAKGLAKEVLEVMYLQNQLKDLYFYDDLSIDGPDLLFNRFPVIRTLEEAEKIFTWDPSFILGLGNPFLRHKLYLKFIGKGGKICSAISPDATIGHFDTVIEEGSVILMKAVITNNVHIGKGVLINPNCTISHDSIVEEFVEISPGVQITGNVHIGSFSQIGTNATILPKITIGKNCIIGAEALVTKDLPDNSLAVGVPAKVIRTLMNPDD